jgi:flagellar protein FliL
LKVNRMVKREPVEVKIEKKKGSSLITQIIVLLVMSGLAGGAGWGMSSFMTAQQIAAGDAGTVPGEGHETSKPEGAKHETAAAVDAHGAPSGGGHGGSKEGEPASLMGSALLLEPIVTNIASPQDVWVRLEIALVAQTPLEEKLTQTIREDMFAYVRTLRLSQLEGPSGFINLKADMLDRAKTRSEDKVSAVLIKTLLFE